MAKSKKPPIVLDLDPETPLEDVRAEVLAHRDPPGVICPACDQLLCAYKRPLYGSMAFALVLLYKYFYAHPKKKWVHVEKLFSDESGSARSITHGGDIAKLRFWNFITVRNSSGVDNPRTGIYSLTDAGKQFVLGKCSTWKWLLMCNGEVLARSEERIKIADVINKRWKYSDLMDGYLEVDEE